MLAEMSSRQLTEWMAFFRVEPFGDSERQAEYRTALVASTVVNMNRDPKKKPIEAETFMRENYLEDEEMDEQTLAGKVFAAFGKKIPTATPDEEGNEEET